MVNPVTLSLFSFGKYDSVINILYRPVKTINKIYVYVTIASRSFSEILFFIATLYFLSN
jgi:hypothetical protein